MVETQLGGVTVDVKMNCCGEACVTVVEEQEYIRAESSAGVYGCQIPVDVEFDVDDNTNFTNSLTIHWNEKDDVSTLDWWEGEVSDYDAGAYVNAIETVTDTAVPDDGEKVVTVDDTNVRVTSDDGDVTAEIVEDDFVEYVEDIVGRGKNVVSTRETSGDHDAVIVSLSSHGSMRVAGWIDTLVNDGGIEVGYVGIVDEYGGTAQYETMEDEWVGRAMICVDDVRDT